MRRLARLTLLSLTISLLLPMAQAITASDWAQAEVSSAYMHELVPAHFAQEDGTRPLRRAEFVTLFMRAYAQAAQVVEAGGLEAAFTDLDLLYPEERDAVLAAWRCGFVSGTSSDGTTFSPLEPLTREQAAVMLSKLHTQGNLPYASADAATWTSFADAAQISDWAREGVSLAVQEGYVQGNSAKEFLPQTPLTLEQGVLLAERLYQAIEQPEPQPEPMVEPSAPQHTFTWEAIAGASSYSVSAEMRRAGFPREPISAVSLGTAQVSQPSYTVSMPNPHCFYTIHVQALDASERPIGDAFSRETYRSMPPSKELLSWTQIAQASNPEDYLTDITVPVWKLHADGSKSESSMTLTVNSELVEEFQAVFQDIFNGKEQFPIYAIHGYRAGTGEHGRGTAVDINYTQNYCVYTNGTVVGDYWRPGDDPFSIPPYGDVVRAFESHGFVWGGDAWQGNQDYMHFSYYGT